MYGMAYVTLNLGEMVFGVGIKMVTGHFEEANDSMSYQQSKC